MDGKLARLREAAAEGKVESARLVAIVDGIAARAGSDASPENLPTVLVGGLLAMLRETGASHVHEAFALLAVALPHAPPGVVRAGSAPLLGAIDTALATPSVMSRVSTARAALGCMGSVLAALPVTTNISWTDPAMAGRVSMLCDAVTSGHAQVRGSAAVALSSVLRAHSSATRRAAKAAAEGGAAAQPAAAAAAASQDALGAALASRCSATISSATSRSAVRTHRMAAFLEAAAPLFPSSSFADLVAGLLAGPASGIASVSQACLRALTAIMQSPRARVPLGLLRTLLPALLGAVPSAANPSVAASFAEALSAVAVRLAATEAERAVGAGAGDAVLAAASGAEALGRVDGEGAAASAAATCPAADSVVTGLPAAADVLCGFLAPTSKPQLRRAAAGALAGLLLASVNTSLVDASHSVVAADPRGAMSAAEIASGNRVVRGPTGAPVGTVASPRAPTALERVAASLESCLGPDRQASWVAALPVVALLFRRCGQHALPLLRPLLNKLLASREWVITANGGEEPAKVKPLRRRQNRDDSDEDGADSGDDSESDEDEDEDSDDDEAAGSGAHGTKFASRRARGVAARVVFVSVDRALGAALVAVGASRFLEAVPLDTGAASGSAAPVGVSDDRAWVLRLLRRHLRFTSTPLAFFAGPILAASGIAAAAAKQAAAAGKDNRSRLLASRALQLWGLFPHACAAPADTATAFGPELGKTLTSAMADPRFPQLRRVVASGLGVLITRHLMAAGEALPMRPAFMGDSAAGGGDDAASVSGMTFMGGISAFDLEGGASFLGSAAGSQAGDGGGGGGGGGGGAEDDDDLLFGGGMGGGRTKGGGGKSTRGASAAPTSGLVEAAASAHPALAAAFGRGARPASMAKSTADAGLAAIRTQAASFLPVLFKQYEDAAPVSSTNAQRILECISAYMAVAEESVVAGFFARLTGLLDAGLADAATAVRTARAAASGPPRHFASVRAAASRVGSLLSLSMPLVPRLPDAQASALYAKIAPVLDLGEVPVMQKRAYKLLVVLAAHNPVFVRGERRGVIAARLLTALTTASASAQRGRLEALRVLCAGLDNLAEPAQAALVPAILAEVVLCAKSSSKRVRRAALTVVLTLADLHAAQGDGCLAQLGGADAETAVATAAASAGLEMPPRPTGFETETSTGPSEDSGMDLSASSGASAAAAAPAAVAVASTGPSLAAFLRTLMAGYASPDGTLRAASALCTARVVFEHSDKPIVPAALPRIVGTTALLLRSATPEVARAAILFARIALRVASPPLARAMVPAILASIFSAPDAARRRVRPPTRNLLDVVVRRFGEQAAAPHVPASDAALFKYVSKMRRRTDRKRSNHLDQVREAAAAAAREDGGMADAASAAALAADGETSAPAVATTDGRFRVGGERAARIAAAAAQTAAAKATGSAGKERDEAFDELLEDDEEEAMAMTAAMTEARGGAGGGKSVVTSRRGGLAAEAAAGRAWLVGEGSNPTDLLDAGEVARVLSSDPAAARRVKRSRDAEEALAKRRQRKDAAVGVRLSADGKVVVSMDDADGEGVAAADEGGEADSDDEVVGREGLTRARREAAKAGSGSSSSAGGAGAGAAASGRGRGGRDARGSGRGRAQDKAPRGHHTGEAFRSRTGKGDARRKGQTLEPYAYVPLTGGTAVLGKFDGVTASTMGSRKASKRSGDDRAKRRRHK